MAYCTQQQLEDRYSTNLLVELSDRGDVATTIIDGALVARAISDADALIDGYLKGVYLLPLASTPGLVTDLSQRIAIYYAHASVASEKITDDYKMALSQLKDVGAGRIKLDVAGVEPEASGGNEVITNEKTQAMTANSMKGFI